MSGPEEIISLMTEQREDKVMIEKAYKFSELAHSDQKRLSGDDYFIHLVETAKILAEFGMGAVVVAAGLLHDSLEDGKVTANELKKEFGAEILFLVEGVTKLGKLRYRGADRHNESLRKLFVAMSQDIRVLMIKFADRLHNMRTLSHVDKDKQKRIAGETLEIFAPIAYRLGIRKLSRELEDLSFPYVYPKEYERVKAVTKEKHEKNVKNLEDFLKSIKKALAKEGLINVRTEYRVKGLYSLYKKLQNKEHNEENIYDIMALRIIVPELTDCYRALGIIHGNWQPLPGRIKDYIALPKPNGYQSIHTTVFTGNGSLVEIQIRTADMHEHAEYGIASHISYKEGKRGGSPENLNWISTLLPKHNFKEVIDQESVPALISKFQDIPHWIKDLVKYRQSTDNHEIFNEDLKNDFFQHRIFVFTPLGDVVDLPKDSTPIDFAYSIHSDIGDHMWGAKINGKLVSLDTKLQSGDIVEIITKSSAKPTSKWLNSIKTTLARRQIRGAILKEKLK